MTGNLLRLHSGEWLLYKTDDGYSRLEYPFIEDSL